MGLLLVYFRLKIVDYLWQEHNCALPFKLAFSRKSSFVFFSLNWNRFLVSLTRDKVFFGGHMKKCRGLFNLEVF